MQKTGVRGGERQQGPPPASLDPRGPRAELPSPALCLPSLLVKPTRGGSKRLRQPRGSPAGIWGGPSLLQGDSAAQAVGWDHPRPAPPPRPLEKPLACALPSSPCVTRRPRRGRSLFVSRSPSRGGSSEAAPEEALGTPRRGSERRHGEGREAATRRPHPPRQPHSPARSVPRLSSGTCFPFGIQTCRGGDAPSRAGRAPSPHFRGTAGSARPSAQPARPLQCGGRVRSAKPLRKQVVLLTREGKPGIPGGGGKPAAALASPGSPGRRSCRAGTAPPRKAASDSDPHATVLEERRSSRAGAGECSMRCSARAREAWKRCLPVWGEARSREWRGGAGPLSSLRRPRIFRGKGRPGEARSASPAAQAWGVVARRPHPAPRPPPRRGARVRQGSATSPLGRLPRARAHDRCGAS